jgi:hypothetical protein
MRLSARADRPMSATPAHHDAIASIGINSACIRGNHKTSDANLLFASLTWFLFFVLSSVSRLCGAPHTDG